MSRLFVAVWPTPAVRAAIEQLPRPDEPGVRWVPPAQWHVTLRFLGDADESEAEAALAGLDAQEAVAEVGPAVSRLGRTVLCLPVRGLDELAAAVVDATAAVGEPPDPRFTGHLTLARLRHRGSCRLAGHRLQQTMPVTEVALVASTLGADGPTYRTLAQRRLAPSPAQD